MRFAYGRYMKIGSPGPTRDLVVIMLTNIALAPAVLRDDGEMSPLIKGGRLTRVTMEMDEQLNPLRTIVCGTPCVYLPRGSLEVSAIVRSRPQIEATVTRRGAEKSEFNVTFRAVMGEEIFGVNPESKTEIQPSDPRVIAGGTTLPAGGGEPGRAYLAYQEALRKGDFKAMSDLSIIDKDQFRFFDRILFVKTWQKTQRSNLQIVGGSMKDDHAILQVKGTPHEPGGSTDGTAWMTKESGRWKMSSEDWETTPADLIQAMGEIERSKAPPVTLGLPLASNGGRPGDAWRQYDRALTKGDLVALSKVVTSADVVGVTTSGKVRDLLEYRPKNPRVSGGVTNGFKATLRLVGTPAYAGATGVGHVTLINVLGQWKIAAAEDWSAGD